MTASSSSARSCNASSSSGVAMRSVVAPYSALVKTNVCRAGESGIDVPQCFQGAGARPAQISWQCHHSRIDPKKSPAQKDRRRKNNVDRSGRVENTGQVSPLAINTLNIVGGRIENPIKGINSKTRNV